MCEIVLINYNYISIACVGGNIYINVANVDLIGTYLNIVTNNNIDNKNLKAVKKRLLYHIAPSISMQERHISKIYTDFFWSNFKIKNPYNFLIEDFRE